MTAKWEYLVRLSPSVVRCGEPLTVHVDKAKLLPREDGLTLELYELDNFIYPEKGKKGWFEVVVENEGMPFDPREQKRNPDDLIATWQGAIVLQKQGDAVQFRFVPAGDVTLAERVQKSKPGKQLALETRFGRLVPIRFQGSDKVWDIPMPFDGNAEEPRDGEGPRLELAVSLKRGGESLYQGGVQAFVQDWRWWSSTSFAPPRAGNDVDFFVDGKEYFDRVYRAFNAAKKYIYITDWKLNPYAVLVRDAKPAEPWYPETAQNDPLVPKPSPGWYERSVGDVLAAAVKRGVDVRVLLWDSASVADNVDDMTACYLMERGVAVAAHNPKGKDNVGGLAWTHHQKTAMVDGEVAFVGGLDLAENRWDTPEHAMFDFIADSNSGYLSRDKTHLDRFRCGGFDSERFEEYDKNHGVDPETDKGSWGERHFRRRTDRATLPRDRVPRMPWHDVHCEVRGPSVHDVERNFVQRWNRSYPLTLKAFQTAPAGIKQYFLKKEYWDIKEVVLDDFGVAEKRLQKARRQAEHCRHFDAVDWWDKLIDGDRQWSGFVAFMRATAARLLKPLPDPGLAAPQKPAGNCVVQVLRSLHEESIVPDAHIETEKSIHECYLRAIESAEHYIYIESQMFLSKFIGGTPLGDVWKKKEEGRGGWEPLENELAPRLLDKIKRKITARVPFHVYIILPEIYDGDPTVKANKEIQFYQWVTLSTLTAAVEAAAKAAGVEPDRYLSVYALRNAGITTDGEGRVRSNLVYVHSKLMIVDDVYLTIGSANANARSMDGYRDTELNVAVVGERDLAANMGHGLWSANKKIRDFRMRLWREHLGPQAHDALLANPSHPETISHWRRMGKRGWQAYDALYREEMKLVDLIERERKAIRQLPRAAANLGGLRREQQAAHEKTLELYRQVEILGHIIDHPLGWARPESKGEESYTMPDQIPK